jgi:hypothetical protein
VFLIADIADEAKDIIGKCSEDLFLKWCSDVVTMISYKADFEGWKGWIDICTRGCHNCDNSKSCNHGAGCGRRCLTLPREVETVLGVNIGGQPTLGFGQLFNFHLNGPGDCKHTCDWSWQDQGAWHCTYKDLITPAKIVAHLQSPEDNGKTLIVYGYDVQGNVLRRNVGGCCLDGYLVPTIFGVAVPDDTAPLIARITGVTKDITCGSVRLATTDSSGGTGVNLAVYEADERLPQYRRIILNRSCSWVRVAYLRSSKQFTSRFDHVPLNSRLGFLLGMRARKMYATLDVASAHAFEADAARLELEVQQKLEPTTTYSPIMVVDRSNARDKNDYQIY